MEEIKPCPFCGNTDLGIGRSETNLKKNGNDAYKTYVYCGICGCNGPVLFTDDKEIWACTNLAGEKTGWNTRQ